MLLNLTILIFIYSFLINVSYKVAKWTRSDVDRAKFKIAFYRASIFSLKDYMRVIILKGFKAEKNNIENHHI